MNNLSEAKIIMEEKFIWMYKAQIWDEDKLVPRAGILTGSSIKEAFDQLYNYYQDELSSVELEDIDCYAEPIRLDPAMYEVAKKMLKEGDCYV